MRWLWLAAHDLWDVASWAELSSRPGVGTAYRRFRNEEEVIEALFEESLREVAEPVDAALDAGAFPHLLDYASSKAAIVNFTKGWAATWPSGGSG